MEEARHTEKGEGIRRATQLEAKRATAKRKRRGVESVDELRDILRDNLLMRARA